MPSYDKTALWQQALGAKVDDPHSAERERLRASYENVRRRAQPLAEAIAKDLPDYTVHDITHSDALWEYAELIAGPNYPLNPCEAFVLGCAFLLHDLGMGLAAYPDGIAELKKRDLWKDTVADLLRQQGVEVVDNASINAPPPEVEKKALAEMLRLLHAERADKLALVHWDTPCGGPRFYLIEDVEVREAFGSIIGRIAFSHWWPVARVGKEFAAVMGAPAGFPHNWTIDPLKLACLLRCADYSHIDERRAPLFLRALRKPENTSDDHWKFQAKLYQPRLEGDRLIFTAKSSFAISEASAWWICFDTLISIDSELRSVDALLADTRRERLTARGVSQVEEPSRLAKLIKTDGWQPVDTRIRVSAVADLVSKLGGRDLYGDTVTPPLREMMQNAADAVRARRLIDNRDADWGEIRIRSGTDAEGPWIEVEDTGIGMSETVLTGPLLDFGTSFWSSPLMHDQLPGLAAKGFQATGRYGIGFFSVFMWGERVEVTTQRFDFARDNTLVLSFKKGLKERPLLRSAQANEYIMDGGTRVKIWFARGEIFDRLLETFDDDQKLTLPQACARLAPCVDVTVKVAEPDGNYMTAVAANDWLTIDAEDLVKRIMPFNPRHRARARSAYFDAVPWPPLRVVTTQDGRVVGRVALWHWEGFYSSHSPGIVTVGGFRACTLAGVVGVLTGSSTRAARDSALPLVPLPVLKEWASAEREARLAEGHPPLVLESLAQIVHAIGVETGGLPIARTDSGWVTETEIGELGKTLEEVLLVHDASVDLAGGKVAKVKLNRGVFAVGMGSMSLVNSDTRQWVQWPPRENVEDSENGRGYSNSLEAAVIGALAKAWGVPVKEVVTISSFGTDDETFEREIGFLAGEPFVDDVNIIRRPTTAGSAPDKHI